MKRYRILSDGHHYRVQRRFRLGPLNFWRYDYLYEVRDTFPKVVKYRVEFDTIEGAEAYVAERLQKDPPRWRHRPFDKPKGWKVVAKISDTHGPPAAETGR